MSKKDNPNTAADAAVRPEEETTKTIGVTKTVKVRIPRCLEFEIGDTVAYTVTEDGAKMRFGTVIDLTDEKVIVQTLSGRFIEREPLPCYLVKVDGTANDYADSVKLYKINL